MQLDIRFRRGSTVAMQKLQVLLSSSVFLGAFSLAASGQAQAVTSAVADANQPQQVLRLVQKEMFVPAPGAFPNGLDVLEVYLTLPGRHPLVVLTHGTGTDPQERLHMTPWGQLQQALWFARRGYVAIVVVRQGYGRSGGKQDTTNGGCVAGRGSFEESGEASVTDLRSVMKFAQSLPEVDASTILSAGVSTGGFAQVALSADPPPNLKAAISFAGGRGGDGHENNCNLSGVIDAFRSYGKSAHKHGDLPMLWIYSENDHWFTPAMAQQFEAAYTKSGAVNQFVMAPPDGSDGHHLYAHVSAWSDTVETFLKAHNLLPLGDQVLLAPEPPNVPMPAGLKDSDAETWKHFLLAPPYKALVVDETGKLWIGAAGFDQPLADDQARDRCKKGGGKNCTIVAKTPGVK
jgi:dienelactone hydrolase